MLGEPGATIFRADELDSKTVEELLRVETLREDRAGATVAFWHPSFPYKSSLTGLTSQQLADKYETDTGKQWNQMLGDNTALMDAGIAALNVWLLALTFGGWLA